MKTLLFVSIVTICASSGQQVGEIRQPSSASYDFTSSSDASESPFDDTVQSNGPVFSYREDSYDEDITSREDPLLIPPHPFSGPWDFQREEISIRGLNGFNTARRDNPTNVPNLPNFRPIQPYPALNSRSIASEGALPSTFSANDENIKKSLDN